MPVEMSPEDVLNQLENGNLAPFYLFYGASEFRLERVLKKIRESLIPEEERDFNLQIFYADDIKDHPGNVIDTARSFPFLSQRRLIIVRRTEEISLEALESFIPYFDDPMKTTCLIFVSLKPDFRKKFYKKIKGCGTAVNFRKLFDNQVVPWIRRMARDIGLDIDTQACAYLQQIIGNQLRELNSELEKIYLRYGKTTVGLEEAKDFASHSRSYTIFELMDQISLKQGTGAVSILWRYLQEEGNDAALGIIGMLIRQMRLLWQAKAVLERGGRTGDIFRELKVQRFVAGKLEKQSKGWRTDELERAFELLYQADGLIKSGSNGKLILENLVLSLWA